MERYRYFLIRETQETEVLAVLDDLSEEDAFQVGEALEAAIVEYDTKRKFPYEPYLLVQDEGTPKHLWYLSMAKESAKSYKACSNPGEVTPWVFVKLALTLVDYIHSSSKPASNADGPAELTPAYATVILAAQGLVMLSRIKSNYPKVLDDSEVKEISLKLLVQVSHILRTYFRLATSAFAGVRGGVKDGFIGV